MKKKSLKKFFLKNNHIILALLIASALATLSYFFKPRLGYDLYAYNLWLDTMMSLNKVDLINYIFHSGEFLIMLYFYFIALMGNYSLVQVFPTLIFYFIIFYMIFDYAKLKKKSTMKVILTSILFCSLFKYVFVVSCMRYPLAYVIFTLGLYLEFIKHKKSILYKFIYIIPIFIHISSFMLLIFRILLELKNKKIIYFLLAFFSLMLYFPNAIIYILDFFNHIKFVEYIMNKIDFYLISEHIRISLQFAFRMVQTFLLIIAGFFCYYNLEKKNTKSIKKHKQYYLYYLIIGIFTLSQIIYYSLSMRFIDMLLFLSPIVILDLLDLISEKNKKTKVIIYSIIILFIVGGIRIQIPIFKDMYF